MRLSDDSERVDADADADLNFEASSELPFVKYTDADRLIPAADDFSFSVSVPVS